jgi:hypothetical protein
MDIVEWVNAPHAIVSQRHTSARFCPPAMIGLVGTLLIHASAIPSLYFSDHAPIVHPREMAEPTGFGTHSKAESADNLVLINLPSIVNTRARITVDVAATRVVNKVVLEMPFDPDPPVFPNIETLPLDEQPESGAVLANGNGNGEDSARLMGIYSGQIQARIERAWNRPRTPVNDGSDPAHARDLVDYFRCQVQIVQDSGGNVQEILLPNCNCTPAWQRSLVMAIQQASPLPAPPDPKVFSRSVSLNLVGYPYVAGRSEDGYETSRVEVAQAVAPASPEPQMAPEPSPSTPIDRTISR